jgi:tetratricopeptide (TPR) repeat protein
MADRTEILVVDSGSSQNEKDIVQNFQKRFDNIQYLRTKQREPLYTAWNRGIRVAKGKYITSANTDDRHRKDAFERMATVLDEHSEVALVYADVIKTETENETFEHCTPTGRYRWYDWDRNLLLARGCFIGPQPMWRRTIHELYGFFDESLVSSGDYEFWLRISQTLDFHHIREFLGLYLDSPGSVEHINRERKQAEDVRIFQEYQRAAQEGELIRVPVLENLRRCAEDPAAATAGRLSELISGLEKLGGAAFSSEQCGVNGVRFFDLKAQILSGAHPAAAVWNLWHLGMRMVLENSSWFRRYRNVLCITSPRGRTAPAPPTGLDKTGGQDMSIVAQMYEDMQPVLQSSRPSDAMRALQNLVRSLPDFARAHNDLGTLYYEAGEKEKAGGHFERAVKLSPETPDFKKNLADFYYVKMSRAEDALRLYLEVLQMRPNDVLTLMTAAHILVSLKRFDEACLHYRRVLDIEPWNHEASENLGRLSALGSSQKIPPGPEVWHVDVKQLLEKGNARAARSQLQQLLEIHPRYALAHNDLGVLCYQAGEKEKALRHYEEAGRLQPDNHTFQKNLADFFYMEQGRIKDAMQIYVRILEEHSEDVETLMAIAHVCCSLSSFDDAATFYKRVLDIEPWNRDAQDALDKMTSSTASEAVAPSTAPQNLYDEASRWIAAGNVQAGKKCLLQLVASHPDAAVAYNDLGVLAYREGERHDALEHYKKAVEREPANLTFRKNLAECYWVGLGRHEDALKTYIDILSSNPEDIETLMGLGKLCTELRQHDDARVFLERVLEIEPWNAGAHDQLETLNSDAKAA